MFCKKRHMWRRLEWWGVGKEKERWEKKEIEKKEMWKFKEIRGITRKKKEKDRKKRAEEEEEGEGN